MGIPAVTILIDTYNHERFIEEAIVSVLEQDFPRMETEILVVDVGARPHVGLVGHGIYEVDSDTGNMKATIPQRTCEVRFDSVDGGRFFRQMMCFFGTSRVAIRRNILSPWETFQTERDDFQSAYKSGSAAYWIFKGFVLGCTLALPPKRFYQLRDWYSRSNWRRVRGLLGEPVPNAEIGNVAVTKPLNSEGKAAH
jgi:hypothetical protein